MQVHPLLQLFLQDYRTDTIEVCGLQIPLAEDQILEMVRRFWRSEELVLEDHAVPATVVHVAMGDLRRAITRCRSLPHCPTTSRDLVYETTATAPPEQLHAFLRSCQEDGFQPARGKMYAIIDRFGLGN